MVSGAGPDRWTAARDEEVVGTLRALTLPNQRRFLFFADCSPDAYPALLDAAMDALDQDVYVESDENDADRLRELSGLGFTVNRREHRYALPTDPARSGLAGQDAPDGFGIVSAADADADRVRELDDTLRQDVPGAEGWRNDPEEFRRQTFEHPEFDPATYLIAVADDGAYAGLVRVWIRIVGPRLGLIAVLPAYRRRGLARALLAQAFGVVHERGQLEAACEVDVTNVASNTLMAGLGARRTGGNVELVRRRGSAGVTRA